MRNNLVFLKSCSILFFLAVLYPSVPLLSCFVSYSWHFQKTICELCGSTACSLKLCRKQIPVILPEPVPVQNCLLITNFISATIFLFKFTARIKALLIKKTDLIGCTCHPAALAPLCLVCRCVIDCSEVGCSLLSTPLGRQAGYDPLVGLTL